MQHETKMPAPSTSTSTSTTHFIQIQIPTPLNQTLHHLSETAFATLPLLALLVCTLAWLIRTYGALMLRLLSNLSRIIVDTAQLLVGLAFCMTVGNNARMALAWTTHPGWNFLNGVSVAVHFLATTTGFFVFSALGIYAIEALTSGETPRSVAEVWALQPFGGVRSFSATKTDNSPTEPPARNSTPDAAENEQSKAGTEDESGTLSTNAHETAIEDDSKISLLGSSEVTSWQSVSKAK